MKNWTLRQRILASFAVIIAIMLLMVVAAFNRLLVIENSGDAVRLDALPGVFYSSTVRGAWVESYVATQHLLVEGAGRDLTGAEEDQYKEFEDRLQAQIANYQKSIFDESDRNDFAQFLQLRERYQLLLNGVLAAYQGDNYALAQRMFAEQLTPAWMEGRKQLNALGAKNKVVADNASDAIQTAVSLSLIHI